MPTASQKQLLQGVIAWILLLVYAVTVATMLFSVWRCGTSGSCSSVAFGAGVVTVATSIGALLSALVVATLARAIPGGDLAIAGASTASGGNAFARWLPWAYIAVWLAVGTAALVIGVLAFPDVNQSVSDLGTAWLGTAIAAAYAFFGIDAPGDSEA